MPSSAQRTPFHERICACLTALPDDVEGATNQLRAVSTAEWPAFVDYAASHGVLAILEPAIERCELQPDVRTAVARRLTVQSMWAQQVSSSLTELLDLFAGERLPVCALKGPVLAERFYGRAVRPSIDIDLLVRPAHLDEARRALLDAGYSGDSQVSLAYLMAHSHHLHFARAGVPELELHFQSYHGFGTIMDAAALMDRASPYVRPDGSVVLVPAPEDELIYLCAHAAGHSFIRLLWLFDLKMLLRQSRVDWTVVRQRSRDAHLQRATAYALWLAGQWVGVTGVPGEMDAGVGGVRRRLADGLLSTVAAPSVPSVADNLGGLLFTSLLCDAVIASAGLVAHHLLRTAKHRAQRWAPGLVPESWSG